MKSRNRFVLLGCVLVFCARVAPAATAIPLPPNTVDQQVTVVGRLDLAGKNYFLDPRFVLVDEHNARVAVTMWAPLEIPPLPPGVPHIATVATMAAYLHHQLSITGIHRLVPPTPGPPTRLGAQGDSYVEVQTVTEVATGKVVYAAAEVPPSSKTVVVMNGPTQTAPNVVDAGKKAAVAGSGAAAETKPSPNPEPPPPPPPPPPQPATHPDRG